MWSQPYLETCCRSALHRLALAGPAGRPADSKDTACLARLASLGLAASHPGGGYVATQAGTDRHAKEIAGR